jgi:hypothetical protein
LYRYAKVYPVLFRKQSEKKPPWGFGGTLSHAAVPSASSTPAVGGCTAVESSSPIALETSAWFGDSTLEPIK